MARLLFPNFYRVYGVRLPAQLQKPPLPLLIKMELPRNSIYHYLGTGPLDLGPTAGETAFQGNNKPIQFESVTELTGNLGNPRRKPIDALRLERQYRVKNPRFRPMRGIETATRDQMALVVYNYSLMQNLYKYMRNYFTMYYTNHNLLATMVAKMKEVCAQTDRNQFVEFNLPKQLPSPTMLIMGQRGVNQRLAQVFSNMETIIQLELWKWLGIHRGESLFNAFTPEELSRINFVFRESGHWMMINLGKLNNWRRPTKEELEANPALAAKGESGSHSIEPVQMQKRVLRMMMSLFEARTSGVEENLGNENEADPPQVTEAKKDYTGVSEEPSTKSEKLPPADALKSVEYQDRIHDDESDPTIHSSTDDDEDDDSGREENTLASDGVDHEVATVDQVAGLHQDPDIDAQVDADLEVLEKISSNNVNEPIQEVDGVIEELPAPEPLTLEAALIEHANALAENAGLSAAEYRRAFEQAGRYKSIASPDPKLASNLGDFIKIPNESLAITKSPNIPNKETVLDKTMLHSSLLEFDKKYINEVMQRDVAAMCMNLQRAGVLVQDYQVERVDEITGSYNFYSLKIKPLQGASSTLIFRMPVVNDDGTFVVSGTKYRSRKQRGAKPIQKVAPDRVALTSYYGKIFAQRDPKKVNNYGRWVCESIMNMGLSGDIVFNVSTGDSFDNSFQCPRIYSAIAQTFRSFDVRLQDSTWHLVFESAKRAEYLAARNSAIGNAEDYVKTLESSGNIFIGLTDKNAPILMGPNGALYTSDEHGVLTDLPYLEDVLGIRNARAPIDFAELRVFGQSIPIGVVLGYLLGLDELLKRLKVNPRIVPAGQRAQLGADEWAIVFLDETWVFSREDALATMVLAGWRDYDATRTYSAHEFNSKDVYFNALEDQGLGVRYLRELDLMNQLFIDHITYGLLEEMKEPVVFTELLIRSSELLLVDKHHDELDASQMRIKGYERFAGILYGELVRSVRIHNAKANKSMHAIEMNPYAVWISIADDPAKIQISEINPIEDLKSLEAVTYSGHGGRSSRSLTKRTRAFHDSDKGLTSEATADSSSVAINTFLTADPQFTSLRGTSKPYVDGKTGATALFSTSALISPAADRDDPKRTNFISIQHSHGVACEGYHQTAVRTGYEQIVGSRNSDLFCFIAKKPGKVISLNDSGVVVEYNNGEKIGVELGRRYGSAAGLTIPHDVVPNVVLGQEFSDGDCIAYNKGFFEPDVLNPKQVIWKSSMLVKTVLLESTDTLEDSSAISSRISRQLRTQITSIRTIVVSFEQEIHRLVKAGDSLEYESILCVIEDAVTAGSGLIDSETLDTLQVLSSQTPQAKSKGVVERVEIYYNGDREDMSESLEALTDISDKQISRRMRSMGRKPFTGSVDENFRIENEPLNLDTAAIRIYITSDVDAGTGDKGVFANQLKTVFGRVYEDNVRTESGTPIDAVFGALSVDDRIVTSPFVIGTTTTLLKVIGEKAVEIYES